MAIHRYNCQLFLGYYKGQRSNTVILNCLFPRIGSHSCNLVNFSALSILTAVVTAVNKACIVLYVRVLKARDVVVSVRSDVACVGGGDENDKRDKQRRLHG